MESMIESSSIGGVEDEMIGSLTISDEIITNLDAHIMDFPRHGIDLGPYQSDNLICSSDMIVMEISQDDLMLFVGIVLDEVKFVDEAIFERSR